MNERGPATGLSAPPPSGLRLRARQAPNALRRIVRHPDWFVETVRSAARRRRGSGLPFSLAPYRDVFVPEAEAVSLVTGRSAEEYEATLSELWTPLDELNGHHPTFGARPALVRIVAGIVRLLAPATIVETGVAQGVTTATILHALQQNGNGRLHSIDLPVLYQDEDAFVGHLVPADLRERWTLHLGPSRRLLSGVTTAVDPLDLFIHDADHTYEAQLEEYRIVWPHLKRDGVLISDDVENPAFLEFAKSVGERPYLIGDPTAASAVGLLKKSA